MSMYSDMNMGDHSRYNPYQGPLNTVVFLFVFSSLEPTEWLYEHIVHMIRIVYCVESQTFIIRVEISQ